MIKFFRHIRQRLVIENRFSRYLLYAIGEIILVMIGILLAIQVNTWYNNRIQITKEQATLKRLKSDFITNIHNVDIAYNNFSEAYEASAVLLEIIGDDNDIDPSEIEHLLDDIINKTMSLDIITGTLDEIFNTGSFNLIKDADLKKQLSNWSYYKTDTEDDIEIYRDYLFDFFIPSLTKKALLRNMEVPEFFEDDLNLRDISKSDFAVDYNRTLRTMEFENELYNNTLNYMYTLNSYMVFKGYLTETLERIEINIDD